MQQFSRNLLTEWRRLGLAFAGETFLVAVSGGADSIGLAAALYELRQSKKLNVRLVVAHFNHELRGAESDEDEMFVRRFAEKFEFELACGKIRDSEVRIENQAGNLEQNARRARYEFLFETAENLHARAVLTAHTLNDQAETFLLNLIRGSGLEGLGGMKAVRNAKFLNAESEEKSVEAEDYEIDAENFPLRAPHHALQLVRPLLGWATRERTENFCLENKIEFRFDSMNENLAYRRVRIRKILLPMLADFNPKIVETLAKTANLLREDFSQLRKSAVAAVDNFHGEKKSGDVLELKVLKDLFPSVRRQILREWLKGCRGNLKQIDCGHLKAIEDLIASRKSGRQIELPGGANVVKSGGRLSFEKTTVEKSAADNYNQGLDSEASAGAFENND